MQKRNGSILSLAQYSHPASSVTRDRDLQRSSNGISANQAAVLFDSARKALQQALSVDEAKKVRDKAEVLRSYIKQCGHSLQMQNECAEIKLRAERRAGDLL